MSDRPPTPEVSLKAVAPGQEKTGVACSAVATSTVAPGQEKPVETGEW